MRAIQKYNRRSIGIEFILAENPAKGSKLMAKLSEDQTAIEISAARDQGHQRKLMNKANNLEKLLALNKLYIQTSLIFTIV